MKKTVMRKIDLCLRGYGGALKSLAFPIDLMGILIRHVLSVIFLWCHLWLFSGKLATTAKARHWRYKPLTTPTSLNTLRLGKFFR